MLKAYRANKGKMFPLRINKKLFFITDKEDLTVDMGTVDYATKVSLDRAVAEKDISAVEIKAPKKAKGE